MSGNGKSYGRGLGSGLGCRHGLENNLGLCYPFCPTNYTGVGPVCKQMCPDEYPVACGYLCMKENSRCRDIVLETGKMVVKFIVSIAEAGSELGPIFGNLSHVSDFTDIVNNIMTVAKKLGESMQLNIQSAYLSTIGKMPLCPKM